jgi:hypothetical protein
MKEQAHTCSIMQARTSLSWYASRSKAHGRQILSAGRQGLTKIGQTTLARNGLAPLHSEDSQCLVGSHPERNLFGQVDSSEESQPWLAQTRLCISWYTKVICNSFAIVSDNLALFDLSSGRRWQTGQYSIYVAENNRIWGAAAWTSHYPILTPYLSILAPVFHRLGHMQNVRAIFSGFFTPILRYPMERRAQIALKRDPLNFDATQGR